MAATHLTDFARLTQEERDTAWAKMHHLESNWLVMEATGWVFSPSGLSPFVTEHKGREVRQEIGWWRHPDKRGMHQAPILFTKDPAAAYELLMWVREQGEEFQGAFQDALNKLWARWRHPVWMTYWAKWWLFKADQPDAIARAVVEAAIAVSAEGHRQVAEESTELAQKFMDSLTGPEQHD